MSWTPIGIDGVFFLSVATLRGGGVTLAVKMCYKSKCKTCSICFGLIQIERDTAGEEKIDQEEIELGAQHPQEGPSLESKV